MSNPFGDEEVSSANPFGDEEVEQSQPGLVTAVKRGYESFGMGRAAVNASNLSDEIAKLPNTPEGQARRAELLGGIDNSIGDIRSGATMAATMPSSPEYEEFKKTKGFWDATGKLIQSPLKILPEIVGESLGAQAPTLPLAAGGAVAGGPLGLAAVVGGSSMALEYNSGVLQAMFEMGVDVNNPAAVAEAMQKPEFKQARSDAMKKSAVVGGFDAATAGMAGVKLAKKPLANIGAQMGLQGAGGGLGEVAGSYAADEEVMGSAVVSEIAGEMPGGMIDTATLAMRPKPADHQKALNASAAVLDHEIATGTTPVQMDLAQEVVGENRKPKLNKYQAKIVLSAAETGLDPQVAMVVSSIETGGKFNPEAKNPTSSAHGLFQIIDSTWEELGGGDRNDVDTQIRNGVANLNMTKRVLEKSLGRLPTGAEIYLGHQLGPAGGAAAIKAARLNPTGSFADTVRAYDPKNADAIIKNNGYSGKSNAEAVELWTNKYAQHNRKLGGDTAMNDLTKAGYMSDVPPLVDPLENASKIADEIDAELAELEIGNVTEEDIRAAKEEDVIVESTDTEALADGIELDDKVDVMAEQLGGKVEYAEPVLPRDLQGTAPKYAIGTQGFDINFTSDIDRAAYMVANNAKRQPRDGDYLDFLQKSTGMTLEEARAYGDTIRGQVKEMARAAKGTDQTQIVIGGLTRADSFATDAELKTRAKYPNPNDASDVSSLPILSGEFAGKTLKQAGLKPGVTAVGLDSAQTPLPYMQAMEGMMQEVLSTYAPQARVALSFQTLGKGDVSSYHFNEAKLAKAGRNKARPNLYRINLRNAANLGRTDDGTQNTTTQLKIVYAAYHEAGHVIADAQMTANMTPETLAKFRVQGEAALAIEFTPEDLAPLSYEQQQVLIEYNTRKAAVLNNEMTVQEFMDTWLSPWKLGHGLGRKGVKAPGLPSFLKRFFGETSARKLNEGAAQFAKTLHNESDILSPHEYMAEQMARYAFATKMPEQNPGIMGFFARALATLRDFFANMKKQQIVKPGIAFAQWVDSLTTTTKVYNEDFENIAVPEEPAPPKRAVEKAAPRASAPARAKAPPKAKVTKVAPAKKSNAPAPKGDPIAFMLARPDRSAPVEAEVKAVTEKEPLLPLPENTTEQLQASAPTSLPPADYQEIGRMLRSNPTLKELRIQDPEAYNNLMDMLKHGQMEELKSELDFYLPEEQATQIRWDTDNEEHQQWADIERTLTKGMPKSFGLKRWFGDGLRRLADVKYLTLNMQQVAFRNPDNAGLQYLQTSVTEYKAYKAKLELRGLEVSNDWSKLGKEQMGLVEQAMREELASGQHVAELAVVNRTWRFVPNAEFLAAGRKKGLNEQALKVWLDMKNAHLHHMNSLQNVMRYKIQERYSTKPKTKAVKLAELHKMFQVIRTTPFLPQTRFGKYAMKVLEKTPEGTRAVHVEFFETAAMRDQAISEITPKLGPNRVIKLARYDTAVQVLRTLPPEVMSTAANEFDLTPSQKKELKEIADIITRNRLTRRYSTQLASITGANKEMLRNFADFMWHNSNNIAKLHYVSEWRKGLQMMHHDREQHAYDADTSQYDEQDKLVNFATKYVDHWKSPADEWQKVRAFVVVKMLWGKISTAVANALAVQNVWALAATQQGMIMGTAATGRAVMQSVLEGTTSTWQKISRQPVEGSQVFNEEQRWALDQAKNDGILDESYAAQLATFAQTSTLSRLNFTADKRVKQAIWAGMLPQHIIEKTVRRTTLLQQFDFYRKRGEARDTAYLKAKTDTFQIDGDNTITNRPAFMRGKAAAFMIFYGFVQNQLYLLSGSQEKGRNYREALYSGAADNMTTAQAKAKFAKRNWLAGETTKMWMAYLFLGGVMGLPGSEDLDKVLELVSKSIFGSRFSLSEYAYEMAGSISEGASKYGVDINPRSIIHGNMSEFSFFGLLPEVDISPSVSLGNALPGLGKIDQASSGAGGVVMGAMGPLGSVVNQFFQIFGDDPSMAKKLGFFAPNAVNQVVKTLNEWDKGVRHKSGGRITVDTQTGEVRDLTTGEKVASLMGWRPSIVSANQELHWMQRDKQKYWSTRRNTMMAQYFEALSHGDREAQADADAKLEEYNEKAPPELAITAKELRRSMKARAKTAAYNEAGLPLAKRYQGMYDEQAKAFGREDLQD